MSEFDKIPEILRALSVRAAARHPYARAQVLCSSDGWISCINDLKIWTQGHSDVWSALAALDRALARTEDRDGALARTLGVEVAA